MVDLTRQERLMMISPSSFGRQVLAGAQRREQTQREQANRMFNVLAPAVAMAQARMEQGNPRPEDNRILNIVKPQLADLARQAGLPEVNEQTLIEFGGSLLQETEQGEQFTLGPGQVRFTPSGQPIAAGVPQQRTGKRPAFQETNLNRIIELKQRDQLTPDEEVELEVRTQGRSVEERDRRRELDLMEKQIRGERGTGEPLSAREQAELRLIAERRTSRTNLFNLLMGQSMGQTLMFQPPPEQQPQLPPNMPPPGQFKDTTVSAPDGSQWRSDGEKWDPVGG